jgi:hypothetical protein
MIDWMLKAFRVHLKRETATFAFKSVAIKNEKDITCSESKTQI